MNNLNRIYKLMGFDKSTINEISIRDAKSKFYGSMNDNIFNRIVSLDPSVKKNTELIDSDMTPLRKWLLDSYNNNTLNVYDDNFIERLKKNIKIYYNNSNQEIRREIEPDIKDKKTDITPKKFCETIEALTDGNFSLSSSERININTRYIYEDDNWKVVSPLSREASLYWGKNSHWCTASSSSKRYFPMYSNKYKCLFIFLNKNPKTKKDKAYQMAITNEGKIANFHDFEDTELKGEEYPKYIDKNVVEYILNNINISELTKETVNIQNKEEIISTIQEKKKINSLIKSLSNNKKPKGLELEYWTSSANDNVKFYNYREGEDSFIKFAVYKNKILKIFDNSYTYDNIEIFVKNNYPGYPDIAIVKDNDTYTYKAVNMNNAFSFNLYSAYNSSISINKDILAIENELYNVNNGKKIEDESLNRFIETNDIKIESIFIIDKTFMIVDDKKDIYFLNTEDNSVKKSNFKKLAGDINNDSNYDIKIKRLFNINDKIVVIYKISYEEYICFFKKNEFLNTNFRFIDDLSYLSVKFNVGGTDYVITRKQNQKYCIVDMANAKLLEINGKIEFDNIQEQNMINGTIFCIDGGLYDSKLEEIHFDCCNFYVKFINKEFNGAVLSVDGYENNRYIKTYINLKTKEEVVIGGKKIDFISGTISIDTFKINVISMEDSTKVLMINNNVYKNSNGEIFADYRSDYNFKNGVMKIYYDSSIVVIYENGDIKEEEYSDETLMFTYVATVYDKKLGNPKIYISNEKYLYIFLNDRKIKLFKINDKKYLPDVMKSYIFDSKYIVLGNSEVGMYCVGYLDTGEMINIKKIKNVEYKNISYVLDKDYEILKDVIILRSDDFGLVINFKDKKYLKLNEKDFFVVKLSNGMFSVFSNDSKTYKIFNDDFTPNAKLKGLAVHMVNDYKSGIELTCYDSNDDMKLITL